MGIANILTELSAFYSQITKKGLDNYNIVETAYGKNLIAKDGSIGTILRIDGSRVMMNASSLRNMVENNLTLKMSSYFGRKGNAMQVFFSRDPDLSKQLVVNLMKTPRVISKRLNLNLDDVFAERERVLPDYLIQESFYIVLWTRISALTTKIEINENRKNSLAPSFWPRAFDTQKPFLATQKMLTRHSAFVSSFIQVLDSAEIRAEALESHEAIRVIKSSIYPDMFDSKWKPYLPGDVGKDMNQKGHLPWMRRPTNLKDCSYFMWPTIDEQLFDREAEIINQHIVRVGKYLFGNVDITIGPQDVIPFSNLINTFAQEEFPWRVSFLLEGDALSDFSFKKQMATFLAFSNKIENKAIKHAIESLEYYRKDGAIPRLRISFATWAPSDRLSLIEDRVSKLQKLVENWGYCHVTTNCGDPLDGVFSSACGLTIGSTATAGLLPLKEALLMMPWNRDSSPFKDGSVLFRTGDSRPWSFEPGSDLQDTAIDIVYSPPGGGKSVLLNTLNLAFCLSPKGTSGTGGAQLPRIAIIDIGPSSSGLISLIKEALPANRRHEAEFHRLRNTEDFCINPFDLQLGCRKPFPSEHSFLVNFITVLATDPSAKSAPLGIADLASRAIHEVYKLYSDEPKDKGNPRKYTIESDYEVDAALLKYNIDIKQGKTTWWQIVDALFEKGAIREAYLAQRFAVPTTTDLMEVVRLPQIGDIFGDTRIESGESIINAFSRLIASCLTEYKILTKPTKFDLGEARIVSLDLDEMAPQGSDPARKQSAMIYMLARYVLAKDFYLSEDNVKDAPEQYQSYHQKNIRRTRETPKRIVFDEFHRTSSIDAVRQQAIIDMREGRKYNVQITLSSQLLSDFSDDMLKLAQSFWILKCPEGDIEIAKQKFALTSSAVEALRYYLNGPKPYGAPFLVVMKTRNGNHEHLLYNKLGPMELWAFSTTPEDVGLRNRLYRMINPVEARRQLAQVFPNGTARSEISRRMRELAERGEEVTAETAEGVVDVMAREIYERYILQSKMSN